MSESGPCCVKTCASRGSAELFSPFASFEGCSPRSLSRKQPNRDENFYVHGRRRSFHTAWSQFGHGHSPTSAHISAILPIRFPRLRQTHALIGLPATMSKMVADCE